MKRRSDIDPADADGYVALKWVIVWAVAAVLFVIFADKAFASEVPGLPNCGGNAQGTGNNPTVPWTCGNSKTIAGIVGGPVQGVLTVANGTGSAAVTVTVTLPQPQTFDVTLGGFWHIGVSSGPLTARSSGTIPAGSLTATVTTTRTGICNGQFDFQVNKPPTVGQSNLYRLHGPWLTVPACIDTQMIPTTTPPTVTPPLPPVTTVVPGTPTISPPSTAPGTTTRQLPATGTNPWVLFFGGWVILAAGFAALWAATIGRQPRLFDEDDQ